MAPRDEGAEASVVDDRREELVLGRASAEALQPDAEEGRTLERRRIGLEVGVAAEADLLPGGDLGELAEHRPTELAPDVHEDARWVVRADAREDLEELLEED